MSGMGAPSAASLREIMALTIAVVTLAERTYHLLGGKQPDQWESLERSADTFTDHFVVNCLVATDATPGRGRPASATARGAAGSTTYSEVVPDPPCPWYLRT